jgi:energy-coupling factor transport system permease protein
MDSRGFDSRRPRTAARRQSFGPADAALVAVVVAVVLIANGIAVATGTWHPVLG